MARILGIDPGTQRCGVAITDSKETIAFPRDAMRVGEDLVERLAHFANEEGVELVVVGRPVSLAGRVTQSTVVADELYARLSARLDLPVVQHDERLTTTSAQRALQHAGVTAKVQRGRVDSAAAVVMLQHYADSRNAR